MDWATLGNYLILLIGLALQAGWFDMSDEDDAPLDDPYAMFDGDGFGQMVTGTETADSYSFEEGSIAWFALGGEDTASGSGAEDFTDLGAGDDLAGMGGGDDTAQGGDGNDLIYGGAGNDSLMGDAGADTLDGQVGDDTIYGGAGDDLLLGDDGADLLWGGEGNDTLSGFDATASGEADQAGIDGADTLQGGAGKDTLILGRGDMASGGSGADLFQIDDRWAHDGEISVITDYDAQDQIELLYAPQLDENGTPITPDLTTSPDVTGENSVISMDGSAVAVVVGTPDLQADQITLTAQTDL
ncbi:hypothetical protein BFP70_04435 [Thioclava sp. SK-1]|uniref:calcium-binding protein n=1 Tax=Thioclava sp. SK-1 TaxID=1889770 RepID=UPI0008260203|nr:calcium-binding protein [Thioclava sp. SK-1]OCX66484.1 hypothetical protein BFP70_04435 [Thioclava sp. SK-1]